MKIIKNRIIIILVVFLAGAGYTIWNLLNKLEKYEDFFHYRNIDVSSIKEVAKRWFPNSLDNFSKEGGHRAMSDVLESICFISPFSSQTKVE